MTLTPPTPTPWESQLSIYSLPAQNPPLTALLVMLELDPLDISPLPGGTVWTFVMTALQEHSGRRGLVFLVLVLFPFFLFLQHIIGHPVALASVSSVVSFQEVTSKFSRAPVSFLESTTPDDLASAPAGPQRVVHS